MSDQWVPSVDLCHWNPYWIGVVPLHVPGSAVNVAPSTSVPVIDGRAVCTGAAAPTTAVVSDGALMLPSALVATSSRRTVWFTSSDVSVYVAPLAPPIAV